MPRSGMRGPALAVHPLLVCTPGPGWAGVATAAWGRPRGGVGGGRGLCDCVTATPEPVPKAQ